MTAVKWHEGRMAALDTETTGVDPLNDRIVTAAVVHTAPGQRPATISWIIDPGIEIPDEAAEVHGWTNERLTAALKGHQAVKIWGDRRQPVSRKDALSSIAAQAYTVMDNDAPLVVANAAYDLTLLEAELARHSIQTLSARAGGIRGVVDPMVLEKQWDPYRKVNYKDEQGCRGGKHKCGGCGALNKQLASLCAHYGVVMAGGAHDASVDAIAALRLTKRLAGLWPDIARLRLSTLHSNQVGWRREQMKGLRDYFDRAGIEHDGCDGGWPVHDQLASVLAGAA